MIRGIWLAGWFLLGFMVVFALGTSTARADYVPYDSATATKCRDLQFHGDTVVIPVSPTGGTVDDVYAVIMLKVTDPEETGAMLCPGSRIRFYLRGTVGS